MVGAEERAEGEARAEGEPHGGLQGLQPWWENCRGTETGQESKNQAERRWVQITYREEILYCEGGEAPPQFTFPL